MVNKICSDNYKQFIRGIDNSSFTISDIVSYTRKSMHLLADDLHIGRLEAIVSSPPTTIDRVGYNGNELLFQNTEGYNPILHSMEFNTSNGVSITMNAYPVKGYSWDDNEKDDLYFACSNFFSLVERSRLASIIKRAMLTESMTGASNIGGLLKTGGRLKSMGILHEFSLLFLNIKDFKYINKRYGIPQGDSVLRGFVDVIYGFLLPDETIARLGGDNFAVLIGDDRVDAFLKLIAPLVLTAVNAGNSESINVNFRVGICDIEEENDIGEAITNASTALAESRQEGAPDIIRFSKTLNEKVIANKQATYMFADALRNREFVVYYQPKVSLDSDKLCGAEALVRWIREGRVIPPLSFILALEHDGSICDLDFYVFENVCRDIRSWIDKEIEPVTISINFSKHHLKNNDFATKLISVMERYNIDSKYIEIELTESACYEDFDRLKDFLKIMKKHNISVSIDDFGTGYSSLSLLKDLSVDIIKLDQSFVKAIDSDNGEESTNDMVVIKNIVNMVDELDIDIIAEGVETLKEANFLRSVHCNMAQGFLFNRPMPRDDYEVLLRGNRNY